LKASIPANPPPEYTPGNVQLQINPAVATNVLPDQSVHSFKVRLNKGGVPLAGATVTVQVSAGTLSSGSGTTDANGEASFTLTSTISRTVSITATTTITLPAGTRFIDKDAPADKQRLVLGEPK